MATNAELAAILRGARLRGAPQDEARSSRRNYERPRKTSAAIPRVVIDKRRPQNPRRTVMPEPITRTILERFDVPDSAL